MLSVDTLFRNKTLKNYIFSTFVVLLSSFVTELTLYYFLETAPFAPFGVDGIAMMVERATKIPYYYTALAINIPLLIFGWFALSHKYVIFTALYSVSCNLFSLMLATFGMPHFAMEEVGSALVSAVFAGVILGFRTGVLLRVGGSSGGIDIVASAIQKKHPYVDVEKIITLFCYATIVASAFVYIENASISVFLALILMFAFERGAAVSMRDTRNAVEFKIITKNPESIRDEIVFNLKHGATLIESRGMYTDTGSSMILTVVNIRQIPTFLEIMKKYPDTFVYYSEVGGVSGNFRWKRDDEAK